MFEEAELERLVAAAQAGDPGALEHLLAKLRPVVLRRCSRFLPHHADAEEAAQDALLSISTHLGGYGGHGSFLGWVTVIASNAARSTYRSMRRRAEDSHADLPESVDPRTTSVIAGTRLDLMEALAALEQQHPALVESFVLRDLGDLTYVQVAEQLDAPLGTVKDRIHQARRFMRGRLVTGL
ncbi:RNA polymerase sigma-70 factor (ECF subfamily) [Streptomyces sp. 1114.5]|uniref:RNA polymerase sigma factor n=1 Tax=unclassified Streptomyces TaxID=2593676 RepID=UPI000BD31033|nr:MULTISPECIES: RNA polymerase sigma factor [unclassified Streptomyces]RKT16635.1 RNA polymerase sigma-70 factor (ECF subfamily) [Streptomyces sp. 1114.5]SOB82806.1 RNA polymerase sigma-70 factor, ECF subfamily [Streptomyces sp. 1331.2]